MLDAQGVFEAFAGEGIEFFTGVPDSLLKDFCAYVTDHVAPDMHVIAANEGNAIALAMGHYLGSGKPALVYMQNSGCGNAVNPLLSLADPEVYAIPMVLMVGWRGMPGTPDEPQHVKQGRIMTGLLDALGLPTYELPDEPAAAAATIAGACSRARAEATPVVLLVRPGSFARYTPRAATATGLPMAREDAVKHIIDAAHGDTVVVATTGKTSRELYEYRIARGDGHAKDFLTVGGMGHAASIALGLARARPERKVLCLDGDGAALMHLGAMAIIGQSGQRNLLHVVVNNGAHDSVGGQPTVAFAVDLGGVATACGYREVVVTDEPGALAAAVRQLQDAPGPAFLEVRVNKGARDDLGRPRGSPRENRDALMRNLGT